MAAVNETVPTISKRSNNFEKKIYFHWNRCSCRWMIMMMVVVVVFFVVLLGTCRS